MLRSSQLQCAGPTAAALLPDQYRSRLLPAVLWPEGRPLHPRLYQCSGFSSPPEVEDSAATAVATDAFDECCTSMSSGQPSGDETPADSSGHSNKALSSQKHAGLFSAQPPATVDGELLVGYVSSVKSASLPLIGGCVVVLYLLLLWTAQ
jgi:hypothetical protein